MSHSEVETKTIEVPVYRDREGNPTCAKDFTTGAVCQFYRTQRMGCHETCVFAENAGRYAASMLRRGDIGSLIPLNTCPLWPSEPEAPPPIIEWTPV